MAEKRRTQSETVTDKILYKIANQLGPEWLRLGLILGLKISDLDILERKHPHSVHCTMAMLRMWREDPVTEASMTVLMTALTDIGRTDLCTQALCDDIMPLWESDVEIKPPCTYGGLNYPHRYAPPLPRKRAEEEMRFLEDKFAQLKTAPKHEMITTVKEVAEGESYGSKQLSALKVMKLLREYEAPDMWHLVSYKFVVEGKLDISGVVTAEHLLDVEWFLCTGEARNVTVLDVGSNYCFGKMEAVESLCRMVARMPQLRELRLRDCQLTDEGMDLVCDTTRTRCPNMELLGCQDNKEISSAIEANVVETLRRKPGLKIDLSFCALSRDACVRLEKMFGGRIVVVGNVTSREDEPMSTSTKVEDSTPVQTCNRQLSDAKVLHDRFYWNFQVGPGGATLQVDSATLMIPKDALDREHTITLAISCNKTDMPQLNSDQRLFGPIIHCLPHGLHFKKPATLSFDVSQAAKLKEPPNIQVWYSESDVGETVDWKVHETRSNSTNQCFITIDHMCLFSTIITMSGQKVEYDHFQALVYISSHEHNAKQIEVCCVHSAYEEIYKREKLQNDDVLLLTEPFVLQSNGKADDGTTVAGKDVSISISGVAPKWSDNLNNPEKVIKFCNLWEKTTMYPSVSFVLDHNENKPSASQFCTLRVGQQNCEIGSVAEFIIMTDKVPGQAYAPKPKECVGDSQRWDTKLDALKDKPNHELVPGLPTMRLCTQESFRIPVHGQCRGKDVYVGLASRGRKLAVKMVRPDDTEKLKERENEADILVQVNHTNLVSFMDQVSANGIHYYVTELCDYTLDEWIKAGNRTTHTMIKGFMEGLKYLHSNHKRMLHCDLAPDNVLVMCKGESRVKIADFGFSCKLRETDTYCNRDPEGTNCWKAQEILQCMPGDKIDYKSSADVQVAGMLVHYMMSQGKHPYHAATHSAVEQNIVDDRPDLSTLTDDVAVDLVQTMLSANPDDRPSVEVLLRHPHFWNDDERYQFMAAIGDEPEVATGASKKHKELKNNPTRIAIEGADVLPTLPSGEKDWGGLTVIPELGDEFQKSIRSQGYTKSVCHLLRLMRNIKSHYSQESPAAKVILGNTRYPYAYFNGVCPKLFPELYLLIKGTAGRRDDWTQREMLKLYFPKDRSAQLSIACARLRNI